MLGLLCCHGEPILSLFLILKKREFANLRQSGKKLTKFNDFAS